MSEWLTTGQMIDRLKVGEVAENQDGYKVTHGRKGDLLYFYKSNEPDEEEKFTMSLMYLKKDKWRIIPKYVCFEEAMEAMSSGATVYFHPKENTTINCSLGHHMGWFTKHTWGELHEGKWTIKEV